MEFRGGVGEENVWKWMYRGKVWSQTMIEDI